VEDDIRFYASYFIRNKYVCGHTHYPNQPLQLLLTCRQIHAEAKLFPFTSNTFNGGHLALRYFVEPLSQEQANAISTIQIAIQNHDVSLGIIDLSLVTSIKEFAKLPQLKRIILSLPPEPDHEALKEV
jgi:hypothetical protein